MSENRRRRNLADAFAPGFKSEAAPANNVMPSQDVLVACNDAAGERELARLHWGRVPFWAKDPRFWIRSINVRAQTAATKPAFRAAFRWRRRSTGTD